LLDEPLSNLDAKLRDQMRHELRDLHAQLKITTVYVTHDQEEAFSLSDQMAVMNKGKVMEIGEPTEIYRLSRTPFGAEFLGAATKMNGRVARVGSDGMLEVATPVGDVVCRSNEPLGAGSDVWVYVRPEEIAAVVGQPPTGANTKVVKARVSRVTFLGPTTEWLADAGGVSLRARSVSFTPESAYVTDHLDAEIELAISPVRCLAVVDATDATAGPVESTTVADALPNPAGTA
jgi:ABC-type Fe3+/spermidine/putrescine transport system ATPase subunit